MRWLCCYSEGPRQAEEKAQQEPYEVQQREVIESPSSEVFETQLGGEPTIADPALSRGEMDYKISRGHLQPQLFGDSVVTVEFHHNCTLIYLTTYVAQKYSARIYKPYYLP